MINLAGDDQFERKPMLHVFACFVCRSSFMSGHKVMLFALYFMSLRLFFYCLYFPMSQIAQIVKKTIFLDQVKDTFWDAYAF